MFKAWRREDTRVTETQWRAEVSGSHQKQGGGRGRRRGSCAGRLLQHTQHRIQFAFKYSQRTWEKTSAQSYILGWSFTGSGVRTRSFTLAKSKHQHTTNKHRKTSPEPESTAVKSYGATLSFRGGMRNRPVSKASKTSKKKKEMSHGCWRLRNRHDVDFWLHRAGKNCEQHPRDKWITMCYVLSENKSSAATKKVDLWMDFFPSPFHAAVGFKSFLYSTHACKKPSIVWHHSPLFCIFLVTFSKIQRPFFLLSMGYIWLWHAT